MFWTAKSTISDDDEEWQLGAWAWLLDKLGGIEELRSRPTRYPKAGDFPCSFQSREAHVEGVFRRVCEMLRLERDDFELRAAEPREMTVMLARSVSGDDVPVDAAATYELDDNRQIITYLSDFSSDIEQLVGIFAHELCHSILFAVPERPDDWGENEEFMTDLAVVFMGFGVFGGNGALKRRQVGSFATTGAVSLHIEGLGYLKQSEWAFALALRAHLTGEEVRAIRDYASPDLYAHFKKNHKYLTRNRAKIDALLAQLGKANSRQ